MTLRVASRDSNNSPSRPLQKAPKGSSKGSNVANLPKLIAHCSRLFPAPKFDPSMIGSWLRSAARLCVRPLLPGPHSLRYFTTTQPFLLGFFTSAHAGRSYFWAPNSSHLSPLTQPTAQPRMHYLSQ